jgi:hypothetical protein
MKVWAFIDWYLPDNVRLFKNKKDVYKYLKLMYEKDFDKTVKVNSKNVNQICDYIGSTVRQIKVE